jgi:arabinogalactan endo-1,4-beta-galactosidase
VFDYKGQDNGSAEGWLKHAYVLPVEVTFKSKISGETAFVDGDFLGGVGPRPMTREGDAFVYRTRLAPGTSVTVASAATAAAVADAQAVTATVGQRASVVKVGE